MDNGNKTTIRLDSPLDINSGDMLVNVSSPKFTYNRQKYLGQLLQNSVRYEADGWFAGWWQHNFILATDRQDSVEPPIGGSNGNILTVNRQSDERVEYYIIQHKEEKLQYTLVLDAYQEWLTDRGGGIGRGTITYSSSDIIHINGKTTQGVEFDVDISRWTGQQSPDNNYSDNSITHDFVCKTKKSGITYEIEVYRNVLSSTEYIQIRKDQPVTINGVKLVYKRDLTTSTWYDTFELTDTGDVSITPSGSVQFELISTNPHTFMQAGLENEYLEAEFKDKSQYVLRNELSFVEKWVGDIVTSSSAVAPNVNGTAVEGELSNTQSSIIINSGEPLMIPTNTGIVEYSLPIWMSHQIKMDYRVIYSWGTLPTISDPSVEWVFGFVTTNTDDYFKFDLADPDKNMTVEITPFIAGKGLGTTAASPSDPTLPIVLQYNDGYADVSMFNKTTWDINTLVKIPDPNDLTVQIDARYYALVFTEMPRFVEVAFKFTDGGQTQPTVDWQPYGVELNPDFDPRPSIASPDPPYGCVPDLTYQPRTVLLNTAKEQAALSVPDPSTIADTVPTVPIYDQYIADPTYNIVVGTQGTVAGVNEIMVNSVYEPNPASPAFDPRRYVAVQEIWNPALNGGVGGYETNPDYIPLWSNCSTVNTPDTVEYTTVTPVYDRTFLSNTENYLYDFGDISSYWSNYYHDTGFATAPIKKPNGKVRVDDGTWLGIVGSYSINHFVQTPNAMTMNSQQKYENQPDQPKNTRMKFGKLRIKFNVDADIDPVTGTITYVDSPAKVNIHTVKDISADCAWFYKIVARGVAGDRAWTWSTEQTGQNSINGYNEDWVLFGIGFPWHPVSEVFERDVYSMPNTWDDREWIHIPGVGDVSHNDQWSIFITCVNTNDQYPLPVYDGTILPGSGDQGVFLKGSYFTIGLRPQLHDDLIQPLLDYNDDEGKYQFFSAIDNIMGLHKPSWYNEGLVDENGNARTKRETPFWPTAVWRPFYADDPSGSYSKYQPLNVVTGDVLNDTNVWSMDQRTGILTINIPHCIKGYSYLDVTTPNIVLSNKDSFAISTVSTEYIRDIMASIYPNPLTRPAPLKCFRIDNNGAGHDPVLTATATRPLYGGGGVNDLNQPYTLNLVQPTYSSLQGTANIQKMMIVYDTTAAAPFYSLSKPSAIVENGAIMSFTLDAYPVWTHKGPNMKYNSSAVCASFMPSQDTQTMLNISVAVDTQKYIGGVTQTNSTNIKSPLNQALFTTITPSFVVGPTIVPTYSMPPPPPAAQVLDPIYQTLTISFGNNNYSTYRYDVRNKVFEGWDLAPGDPIPWTNNYPNWEYVSSTFLPPQIPLAVQQNRVDINIRTKAIFKLQLYRTFLLNFNGAINQDAYIVSQEDSVVTFGPNQDYGHIAFGDKVLVGAEKVQFVNSKDTPTVLTIYTTVNNSCIGLYVPEGIVSRNNNTLEYVSKSIAGLYTDVTIIYKGNTHVVHLDMTQGRSTFVQYLVKDIRTNDEPKEVYRRNINDCFMYVKQFWSNNISTENFWWVDATHVLELTKYDMVLYIKDPDGEVHDWNGDLWDEVWRVPRSRFVNTNDLYYAVSSACLGGTGTTYGLFFKIVDAGLYTIKIQYTNVIASTFDVTDIDWTDVEVPVTFIPLGVKIEPDAMYTYTPIVANAMIQASTISSTCIDGMLMIGIAYTRGLQQWTLRIRADTVSVITGYGHVGVEGHLTGGMIPLDYCSANGFNSAVRPISDLPIGDAQNVPLPEMVVGTDSKVWFVQQKVDKIVTHLTYSGSTHTPVAIALNNNVAEDYRSLSFGRYSLFDIFPFAFGIISLFDNDPVLQVVGAVLTPSILTLNPKTTLFGYISHAVGQYAYKYYNSIQQKVDDKTTDTDVTFAKSFFRQALARDTYSAGGSLFLQIIVKSIGVLIQQGEKATANPDINQSTTDDGAGRKFSQFALDTVNSTVTTALAMTGFTLSLKSKLWWLRSLDMFYSIDNDTQCWAGPGFVNHNLMAQCMAQSSNDLQVEARSMAYWMMLADLAVGLEEIKLKGLVYARDSLNFLMSSVGSFVGGGPVLAAAMMAGIIALNVLIVVSEVAIKIIPGIAEAIGGYPRGEAYNNGYLSKHVLSVEGKHSYGNKSMSLFWPCFDIKNPIEYTNEAVVSDYKVEFQSVNLGGVTVLNEFDWDQDLVVNMSNYNENFKKEIKGDLYSVQVVCRGVSLDAQGVVTEDPAKFKAPTAPDDMAVIEGSTVFLSTAKFKNEQIGVSPPVFGRPPITDYCINKQWKLGVTAGMGQIVCVSQDDTKLMDGAPSNIVITDTFCGVASSYVVIEVLDLYNERYLRPYAVTPNAVAINVNRYNVVHDAKAYHAFDGQFSRLVKWTGAAGLDQEYAFKHYCFQINDHFKRSNIAPPNTFTGNFKGPPVIAIRSYENVANLVEQPEKNVGGGNNIPGEFKDLQRQSIPVFSEPLSTLPAMNRMLAPYKLHVVEGVTGLTTEVRNMQTKFKAPSSVDFNINNNVFRATEEFICTVTTQSGIVGIKDIVASAGLDFIGATTKEGFFYSPATKLYYSFDGTDIQKREVMSRFISLDLGRWDFINQEIIFSATERYATGDAPLVLRLDGDVKGEVWEPLTTIYNPSTEFGGGFKILSMPGGLTYQGPKRFIVNRFIMLEHMIPNIINNKGMWRYAKRELDNLDETSRAVDIVRGHVAFERDYKWAYENFDTKTPLIAVDGWTHNPWCLVTSMYGTNEETDNKYEWTLNFAWTPNMEVLIGEKEYVTVNVVSETVTLGGRVFSRPTHFYLHKQMFDRIGNGYYSAKYQSNNGSGNRERLYIWSDGYIALEDITIDVKTVTANRATPLVTQVDISQLTEF